MLGNQIYTNTIVLGLTEASAVRHMMDLLEASNEQILRITRTSIFTENERYTARFFGESLTGYRCSRLYISRDILLDNSCSDLFSKVILSCLVPPGYYDRIAWNEPYDWREHVFIY